MVSVTGIMQIGQLGSNLTDRLVTGNPLLTTYVSYSMSLVLILVN